MESSNNLFKKKREFEKILDNIETSYNRFFHYYATQFSKINVKEEIIFLYTEDNSNEFIIARYFSKFAFYDKKINNVFLTDKVPCYITTFKRNQLELISIMHIVTRGTRYKLLFGEEVRNICGHIEDSEAKKNGTFKSRHLVWESKETELSEIVKNILSEKILQNENDIYDFLKANLEPFIYFIIRIVDDFWSDFSMMNSVRYCDIVKKISYKMQKEGIVSTRWKNEFELYTLIQSYYNDSIYQYRHECLDKQSIDIFIPSLNIGIEYQGKQHYQQVEIFGGEDGFNKTKERDVKKRIKCEQNGIVLLEWVYNIEISDSNLKQIMQKIGIDLPKKNERKFIQNGSEFLVVNDLRVKKGIENIDEIINKKDLESVYVVFLELMKEKQYTQIASIWEQIIDDKSYRLFEKKHFLMHIDQRNNYTEEFYLLIIKSEKLKNFYLNMESLNYYSRKLLAMIQNNDLR